MSDKIAYTDEMLATIFRRDVNTVRLALKTFENYGMIEIIDGIITIPNWGKHQNFDKIEQKNTYMKEYMRNYREKQKEKIERKSNCKTNDKSNSKANVSEADIDIEKDIEVDKDKEKEIEGERDKEYIPPLIPPKEGKNGNEKPIKRMTSKQLLEKLLPEYNISDYLLEAVNDWVDYKKETFRFSYKEKGMDKLLQNVSESARNYGEEAVRNVIYNSISSGYQGITWNKLESSSGKYQNKTADMLQSSYDMMSEWARKKKMEENGNDV